MQHRGVLGIARALYRNYTEDRIAIVGAGVAFYALLSVFPTLAALVALYGLAFDAQQIEQQVASLAGLFPQQALDVLRGELQDLAGTDRRALGWGAALALGLSLWSASRGVNTLMEALNVAYGAREERNFFVRNGLALLLTLGAIVGAIVALAVVVLLPAVIRFLGLGALFEGLIAYARWPILAAAVVAGLAILYRYGPCRPRVAWRSVARGALFATLLWIGASALFSLYVSNFGSYNKTYGSVAAVVVLLMWFLLTAYAVLLGAELNGELERREAGAPGNVPCEEGERKPLMPKLLNPTLHGALDYGLALAFILVPGALGFGNAAASVSQIVGVAYLLLSVLTRYPLGIFRIVPFPLHGVIEAIAALAWLVMPWVFNFADDDAARLFFVLAGVGLLAVVAVTDYRGTAATYHGEERRHRVIDRRQRSLAVQMDRRSTPERRGLAGA